MSGGVFCTAPPGTVGAHHGERLRHAAGAAAGVGAVVGRSCIGGT